MQVCLCQVRMRLFHPSSQSYNQSLNQSISIKKLNFLGTKEGRLVKIQKFLVVKTSQREARIRRGRNNRQAAIECRKKRKEYVATLEDTIKKMENEIAELKMKINIYEQSEKFKVVSEKESIFSYLAGRDERYSHLEAYIEEYNKKFENNEDLTEINKTLQETVNSIHNRHGSKGVIRRQCTSYLFKKILTKIVPSHVRYLCSS